MSKLTEYEARVIKAAKGVNAERLARRFNVSPRTVYHIWSGQTWKSL